MATKTFTVRSYEVIMSRKLTIGGGAVEFWAQIVCRGRDGDRFVIFFLRPGSTSDNVYNPATKWGTCYLPADQYSWYVDLLRNEKPVRVFLDSDRPIQNRLFTGREPVGEEES